MTVTHNLPQLPLMTAEERFGTGNIIVWDWEQHIHLLRGHLTAVQVETVLDEYNSEGQADDIRLVAGAIKHTWTRFPRHEPGCVTAEPGTEGLDADLCDCEAEESDCFEHTATGADGALPVTWIRIYHPDDTFMPDYGQPDQARAYVDRLRAQGWFEHGTAAPAAQRELTGPTGPAQREETDMGIKDRLFGTPEYREARQELAEVGQPGGPEVDSDEHVARNERVADTEPTWRRPRKG